MKIQFPQGFAARSGVGQNKQREGIVSIQGRRTTLANA
jgi:hypothetical protein